MTKKQVTRSIITMNQLQTTSESGAECDQPVLCDLLKTNKYI